MHDGASKVTHTKVGSSHTATEPVVLFTICSIYNQQVGIVMRCVWCCVVKQSRNGYKLMSIRLLGLAGLAPTPKLPHPIVARHLFQFPLHIYISTFAIRYLHVHFKTFSEFNYSSHNDAFS